MNKILILVCFTIICLISGCKEKKQPITEYWGIPIKRIQTMYYNDGKICYRIYLINDEGLDGFWDSYSWWEERDRTELFLNSRNDTTWYWSNNAPIYQKYTDEHSQILGIAYDSTELKKYVVEKVNAYLLSKK